MRRYHACQRDVTSTEHRVGNGDVLGGGEGGVGGELGVGCCEKGGGGVVGGAEEGAVEAERGGVVLCSGKVGCTVQGDTELYPFYLRRGYLNGTTVIY